LARLHLDHGFGKITSGSRFWQDYILIKVLARLYLCIFVEQSSTKECPHQPSPPPNLETNANI
jgi:hypothetical protein